MEILYECGCGLDGHAKTVVAGLITPDQQERRTFATLTEEVLGWADWLVHAGCTPVARESTGGRLAARLQPP
jgi:hypothetical protein